MNIDWKKLLGSTTIRGLLVAAVAFVLMKVGLPEGTANEWTKALLDLFLGGGVATAFYGRVTSSSGPLLK